jgi:hypothetical protein
MMSADPHSAYSSAREKVLEHLFVGGLLRTLWCSGIHHVEVLRSEFDGSGYDLVIDCDGVPRHLQLKSSHQRSATNEQKINIALASKPSGCVVWLFFDERTLSLGPFLWFGDRPGLPLPALGDRIAKHTKANALGEKAERPNLRVLRKSQFRRLPTMAALAREMFGEVSRWAEKVVAPDPDPPSAGWLA